MTEQANYGFIPWIRQGLGSKINENDTLGLGPGSMTQRAKVDVELVLQTEELKDNTTNENIIRKNVSLYGPGDVLGVQSRAVLRTFPPKSVSNFEANLLPYIEFYEEDFPWRYTPASPTSSGLNSRKLRPWIVLVVLKSDEFKINKNTEGLSSITIFDDKMDGALCDHKDIWAWAHVHLNNKLNTPGTSDENYKTTLSAEINSEIKKDPDSAISRIISPRKLLKSTSYTAFLIPAFETGRLAGLGESTENIAAQDSSWKTNGTLNTTNDIKKNTFPFYYHWDFATGEFGDFESLVSLLKPVVSNEASGSIPMDIQDPGFSLHNLADSKTIGVEGALVHPAYQFQEFGKSKVGDIKFVNKLRQILNLSADLSSGEEEITLDHPFYNASLVDDPIVTPPTYGYWHALIDRLHEKKGTTKPEWIETLNLDPRFRGVAGLGTVIVQESQEELMHRAWEQVGDIETANNIIRDHQFVKKISTSIYRKHLESADGSEFLLLTHALHGVIMDKVEHKTINAVFKESKVPLTAKSAALRRIVRPGKKANRVINEYVTKENKTPIFQRLVGNFNRTNSAITAAEPKKNPNVAVAIDKMKEDFMSFENQYRDNDNYMAKDILFKVLQAKSPENITGNLSSLIGEIIETSKENFSAKAIELAIEGLDSLDKFSNVNNKISVEMPQATFVKIFGSSDDAENKKLPTGKAYGHITINRTPNENEDVWVSKSTSLREIKDFGARFDDLLSRATSSKILRVIDPPKGIENLKNLHNSLKIRLNPAYTLDKKLRMQVSTFSGNNKPIKPIMAYPEFNDAMYEKLKGISQDFILPDVESLPENSITVLKTNQKFIESFMTGLNHEMARELLWREYPTDQRGSYFRQFWDVEDNIFESDPEKKYAIKQLHKWDGELGSHMMNTTNEGYMVLVVRGQLMVSYPNTMVYAQKASYDREDATRPRVFPKNITEENSIFPSFTARLDPDVYLFGFPLTLAQAYGERATSPTVNENMNPGWFFVFQERAGQTKFGLDELGKTDGAFQGNLGNWNELTWEHLVSNSSELESYHIKFDKNISVPSANSSQTAKWGDNSADLAFILHQNPIIFARHAQEMLPEY